MGGPSAWDGLAGLGGADFDGAEGRLLGCDGVEEVVDEVEGEDGPDEEGEGEQHDGRDADEDEAEEQVQWCQLQRRHQTHPAGTRSELGGGNVAV